MLKSYKEYLNDAGKTITKAVEDKEADTGPANAVKRPAKGLSTNQGAKEPKEPLTPYAAPGSDEGQQKYEKGLGNDGDKNLIYNINDKEKDKVVSTFPKAESFRQYAAGFANASPSLIAKETVALSVNNPAALSALILEFKKENALSKLLTEVMRHNGAFVEMAKIFSEDAVSCRQLATAFREIAAPANLDSDLSSSDTDPEIPLDLDLKAKKKRKNPKSVEGEPVAGGMGNDVLATSGLPEHNLVKALASYTKCAVLMENVKLL